MEKNIVDSMIKGYGGGFPPLEDLFATTLTAEEIQRLESPIPGLGRYKKNTNFLGDVTSLKAVGLKRFYVIKQYFFALCDLLADYTGKHRKIVGKLTAEDREIIEQIGIQPEEVKMAEIIESFTDHDTAGAIDYIKLRISYLLPHLEPYIEGIGFAKTSEDTMGNVFGLIANELVYGHFLTELLGLCDNFIAFIEKHEKSGVLLLPAFTHQQTAQPTTSGIKITTRLKRVSELIAEMRGQNNCFKPFSGKMGGATGNLTDHFAAYPDIDWWKFAREFVEGLGLHYEEMTDQSVSYIAEAQLLRTINNILTQIIKLAEDFLRLARCPGQFFVKRHIKGRKGSSIMPGKTNLWAIEGAIRMLRKARNSIAFLADELQNFPDEGDMGRSFLFRDIGNDFMPIFIAFGRIKRELNNCVPNHKKIQACLNEYPGMVGSSLQTVLKREGVRGDAYRAIQAISINPDGSYANSGEFIARLQKTMIKLKLSDESKDELMKLTDFFHLVRPAAEKTAEIIKDLKKTFKNYRECQKKTLTKSLQL